MNDDTNDQGGFTVVELLITIIVAAMFAAMFYQLFTSIAQIGSSSRRNAQANDLAAANLRKYPNYTSTGLSTNCVTLNDTLSGGTLLSQTGTDSEYPGLGPVTELVTYSYPYNCKNSDLVLLISSITYNNGTITVKHATYVN